LSVGSGALSAEQGTQEGITLRRLMVMVFCLFAAAVLCGGPHLAAAEEQQAKEKAADQKQNEKDAKEGSKEESFRDGINRAFDELKKETAKGKKNLNDLYERSKSTSGDEKAK
jgi:hypothetical protein